MPSGPTLPMTPAPAPVAPAPVVADKLWKRLGGEVNVTKIVDDFINFAVIDDKDYAFTLSPEKVFKTAVFMGKVGTVKDPPAKWQDLFFPDIHDLPGD